MCTVKLKFNVAFILYPAIWGMFCGAAQLLMIHNFKRPYQQGSRLQIGFGASILFPE